MRTVDVSAFQLRGLGNAWPERTAESPNKETSNAELGHRHMSHGQAWMHEMHFAQHCTALHITGVHIGASDIISLYRHLRPERLHVLEGLISQDGCWRMEINLNCKQTIKFCLPFLSLRTMYDIHMQYMYMI